VIGQRVLSSLQVRYGTNHPSRRSRTEPVLPSEFFARLLLRVTIFENADKAPDVTHEMDQSTLLVSPLRMTSLANSKYEPSLSPMKWTGLLRWSAHSG